MKELSTLKLAIKNIRKARNEIWNTFTVLVVRAYNGNPKDLDLALRFLRRSGEANLLVTIIKWLNSAGISVKRSGKKYSFELPEDRKGTIDHLKTAYPWTAEEQKAKSELIALTDPAKALSKLFAALGEDAVMKIVLKAKEEASQFSNKQFDPVTKQRILERYS